MRSPRSSTTTSCPARVSCCAAARPAGPGSDHRDPLARAHGWEVGRDPALVPGAVDDRDLDLLDRDRVGVDAEHARRLARRRAQAPGELGEVVGGVQAVDRVAPVVAVDEVVPVGDEVAERAAVVAERDAAVHAAAGLLLERLAGERLVDLPPVEQAHRHRPARRGLATPLEESGGLTHRATSPLPSRAPRCRPPTTRRARPRASRRAPAGSRSASPCGSVRRSPSSRRAGAPPAASR